MEALVVVLLIGAVMAIALPMMLRMFQSYRVQTSAQQIAVHLRFARNAAVQRKISHRITIRDEADGTAPNTYVMESGSGGVWAPVTHIDTRLSEYLDIETGSTTEVIFDPRGSADTTGGTAINLSGDEGTKYRITISAAGGVKSEKTGG